MTFLFLLTVFKLGGKYSSAGHKWVFVLTTQKQLLSSRQLHEIYTKLTVKKTPQRRHWRRFGVFIVNFEHISHLALVFIINFEQVNVSWVRAAVTVFNRHGIPEF